MSTIITQGSPAQTGISIIVCSFGVLTLRALTTQLRYTSPCTKPADH